MVGRQVHVAGDGGGRGDCERVFGDCTVPRALGTVQYEPDRLRLSALDIACRVRGVIVLEWAHNAGRIPL